MILITTEAEAAELLSAAIAKVPALTRFGVGLFCQGSVRAEHGAEHVRQQITVGQVELSRRLGEIAIAADWCKMQVPIAHVNLKCSSYTYKHDVEAWTERMGERQYVSNGSFIAAAVGLGFAFAVDPPNVHFAFSAKSLKASR